MMHLILAMTLAFDLTAVKSEPNLEKRSELALDHANVVLDAARSDLHSRSGLRAGFGRRPDPLGTRGGVERASAAGSRAGSGADLCRPGATRRGVA